MAVAAAVAAAVVVSVAGRQPWGHSTAPPVPGLAEQIPGSDTWSMGCSLRHSTFQMVQSTSG